MRECTSGPRGAANGASRSAGSRLEKALIRIRVSTAAALAAAGTRPSLSNGRAGTDRLRGQTPIERHGPLFGRRRNPPEQRLVDGKTGAGSKGTDTIGGSTPPDCSGRSMARSRSATRLAALGQLSVGLATRIGVRATTAVTTSPRASMGRPTRSIILPKTGISTAALPGARRSMGQGASGRQTRGCKNSAGLRGVVPPTLFDQCVVSGLMGGARACNSQRASGEPHAKRWTEALLNEIGQLLPRTPTIRSTEHFFTQMDWSFVRPRSSRTWGSNLYRARILIGAAHCSDLWKARTRKRGTIEYVVRGGQVHRHFHPIRRESIRTRNRSIAAIARGTTISQEADRLSPRQADGGEYHTSTSATLMPLKRLA
jgi:hypothetical protein